MNHFVHPTAIIEEGAQVESPVVIGHFCFVQKGAVIRKGAKLKDGITVWDKVTIGEDVFVGPSAVFTNDLTPRAFERKGPAGWKETHVERGASIGANATILPVTIGSYAAIAAGAVVTRDVPAHAMVRGNPAHIVSYVCKCKHWGRLVVDEADCKCEVCGMSYPELLETVREFSKKPRGR